MIEEKEVHHAEQQSPGKKIEWSLKWWISLIAILAHPKPKRGHHFSHRIHVSTCSKMLISCNWQDLATYWQKNKRFIIT
jgi:hypothetical protein